MKIQILATVLYYALHVAYLTSIFEHLNLCTYLCIFICMFVCTCLLTYVCTCACTYIYACFFRRYLWHSLYDCLMAYTLVVSEISHV